MKHWEIDKQRTDAYLPTVKAILGACILTETPPEEDAIRNSDLWVIRAGNTRIGVRLRSREYFERYSNQFTIREARPNGTKTELEKILDGWGDYFFYGFMHPKPPRLVSFGILDLGEFRGWYPQANGSAIHERNRDGSSSFVAFKWHSLPREAIVRTYPKCVADGIAIMGDEELKAVQCSLHFERSIQV